MDNRNEKDRCVNCGIRSVPLHLGLDGRLHCADHIGLLLPPDKPEHPPFRPETAYGTIPKAEG